MPRTKRPPTHQPRELRRRVVLCARMRSGSGWTDACILNVSSRGLLIHSARTGPQGSEVELWRGDHMIAAHVVWRDGARVGLRTAERLPIKDIFRLSGSTAPQLTAGARDDGRRPRKPEDSRSHGRTVQFVGVVAIAILLSASTYGFVEQALAWPLALVSTALGD